MVAASEGFLAFGIINEVKSSHLELLCQKAVLKNFAKFTGKHLFQRLFFKEESLAQVFS